MLFTACVPAKITTPPQRTIDFRQYRTVKLVSLDLVGTAYSREGISLFEAALKDVLRSGDRSIVDGEEDLRIEIIITGFQPGHKWLGWIIGVGELAASLTYLATFKDRSGIITAFKGGKSYYGWELVDSPRVMTSEQLRMRMVEHCVTQIGQFIQNNGRLG